SNTNSSEPIPITRKMIPIKSIFSGLTLPSISVTYNKEQTAPTTPIGKLMKNIQCQERCSTITPPNKGPKIGPTINPNPKIVKTVSIYSSGKESITMLYAVVINPPPPIPCMQRQKIMLQSEPDKPHIKEPKVNKITEPVKYVFRPNQSDNIPDNGITIILPML